MAPPRAQPTLAHALGAAVALLSAACGGDPSNPGAADPRDVVLPDPGPLGFQITTDLIDVPAGEEVQNCYFYEVPFDEPVFVSQITLAQNVGSHHMNVFRRRTVRALDGLPGEVVRNGECWKSLNWAEWPLVANSQSAGVEDWELPEGVALRFEPREMLMLQSHYVNATTQTTPTHGKVVVNFHGVTEADVDAELGTLFATNQNIRVCPGQTNVHYEATCNVAGDAPVTVIAANGHFHSRGKRFTMSTADPITGVGDRFYESLTWDEPPFARDLSVAVPLGGGVRWACDFAAANDACGDPDDECCFTFGGNVETNEHCNAFVYYYPRGASDVNCF